MKYNKFYFCKLSDVGEMKKKMNWIFGLGDEKNNWNWLVKMNKFLFNIQYIYFFKEINICICMVIEFDKFYCNLKINKILL